ncbi:MAG TPA: Ig-like domain repeat protein, partial [Terriglobia bacterium]|nr:Ig-like domain repeat protein [Terriglobia bacterium]
MKRSIKAVASTLAIAFLLYAAVHTRGSVSQVPSGAWGSSVNMAEARAGASSVLLPDGRILVTGGGGAYGPLATAELFGAGGSFSSAPSMTFARTNHVAVVLQDGRVLVAGGTGAEGRATDSAEIYDPASNAWTSAGPLMVPRSGHSATLLADGRVLIAGGENSGGVTNTFEIFNPVSNTFSLGTGVLSSPRKSHASAVLQDGRVLMVGGTDGTNTLASSDIYDPATDTIGAGPLLSTPRQGLSATTELDGSVLVAGGNNGVKDLATAEIFDPTAGAFLPAPSRLATPRSGHLAFLLPHNNSILIVGGTSGGTARSSTEIYYPWTGAFNSSGALASARTNASGAPLGQDGLLLLAGGANASGTPLSSAELYGFATVKTDKSDYAPHETVTISGSGWEAGEVVTLMLHEVPTLDGDRKLRAAADAGGNILTTQFSPNAHDDGVRFYLTATGSSSQAQSTFTDKIATTTTVTSSVNPSAIGQAVTFTATVTRNTSGVGTPSRTVQFVIDGVNFGLPVSLSPCASQSACATLTVSTLTAGTHTVEADYSSDVNFLSSSGTLPGGQTVSQASSTTTLASSLNPSLFGQPVTFTATVGVVAPASGTPTGTVIFKDGGAALATVALNGAGVATLSTSSLAVGAHSISAVYNGSTSLSGSTSSTLTQTVNLGSTSTALVSAPNPSTSGQPVTFTATVSIISPATGTPTGSVTFTDGKTTLGSGALNALGVATFSISSLSVGAHSITASYSGNASLSASNSSALTQTVSAGSSSTALVSSQNPTAVGQPVTFTATVSVVAPATGTVAGTVTFKDGLTTLGTGTLSGGGWTTFSTSALSLGSHSITAIYSGDTDLTGSTSAAFSQTVNQGMTSTVVASSINPSVVGQPVTFTGTVSVVSPATGTPTGTMTFKDGTTTLGTGTINGLGYATYSTSALTLATHSITVVYSGDSNFAPSTSAALTQSVIAAKPTTTLVTSSVNPSLSGQPVTFTATVSVVSPNTGTPTGTVTFKDGAATLGSGTVNSSGFATLSTSGLSVGLHAISATYGGDSFFTASTSPALAQTVNQGATSTVLASSVNPSVVGQPVTFTATVGVTAPATGMAAGTVTFKDGSATLGTGTLNALGYTTLSTSALALGAHSITAVYSGNTSLSSSASAALLQNINKGATSTVASSSANPSVVGQTVTFTGTVSVVSPATGTPTGTVTFMDGATTLGMGAINASGYATISTSALTLGTHPITVVYSGDTNFNASTSTAFSQNVSAAKPTTTALVSSANPSVYGQPITFTATVSVVAPNFGTPTGTVAFFDGPVILGKGTLNTSGYATFNTSGLSVATHSITAVYSGDTFFTGSTSPVYSQVVNKASVSTTLTSSLNPSLSGQSVTFTAQVSVLAPGSGTPLAAVIFKDGAVTLATSTPNSKGFTTLTTSALAVGTHSITATYVGGVNFLPGTPAAISQVVNTAPTTTTVSS